jgi:hypothetical protein
MTQGRSFSQGIETQNARSAEKLADGIIPVAGSASWGVIYLQR